MQKVASVASCCLLIVVASGCGGSPGDSLVKEQITLINDLAAEIESVGSNEKIKAIGMLLEANFKSLGAKLSDGEKKKLMEKHSVDINKAMERLEKAMAKAGKGLPLRFPGWWKLDRRGNRRQNGP